MCGLYTFLANIARTKDLYIRNIHYLVHRKLFIHYVTHREFSFWSLVGVPYSITYIIHKRGVLVYTMYYNMRNVRKICVDGYTRSLDEDVERVLCSIMLAHI